MHIKACRLGFKDSNLVIFRLGNTGAIIDVEGESEPAEEIIHWSQQLDMADLLKSLREIKHLDSLGDMAIPTYVIEALKDKYASVRYWGVIGLRNNCKAPADIRRAKTAGCGGPGACHESESRACR